MALLLVAAVFLQAMNDRRHTLEAASQQVGSLSAALAEHTRQTLAGIDLGLVSVADTVEANRLLEDAPAGPLSLHELLRSRQAVSEATVAYFVLDAEGRLVASSRTAQVENVPLNDIPEFQAQQTEGADGLFIGPPRQGRLGFAKGRWIVNLTRRLEHPDGSFAGMVGAVLPVDYLLHFFSTVRLGGDGAVGLFSDTGILIARSPLIESFIGADLSKGELFTSRLPNANRGTFISAYPSDGIRRITGYSAVSGFPAVVYAGLSQDEVLDPWFNRLLFEAAIAALAMALFVGASWAIGSYAERRRRWQEERSRRLKLLADECAHLVGMGSVRDVLDHVAGVSRRLIGARWASATITDGADAEDTTTAVSFEDAGAMAGAPADLAADVCDLIADRQRPLLLTQAELEGHPLWDQLPKGADAPPIKGLLSVPILVPGGTLRGHLCLSGKTTGDFTQDDLNEILQLVSVAGTAIDTLRSAQARDAAIGELTAARDETSAILTSISDAFVAYDNAWRFTYVNDEAVRLIRRPRGDLLGRVIWDFPGLTGTPLHTEYLKSKADGVPVDFEFDDLTLGSIFAVRGFPHPEGFTVYFRDVTDQRKFEAQLRQAQKMDAIGNLTGGIAHDFNNLLTVILGNVDALSARLEDAPPEVRAYASTIQRAGERGAELTHRLLAFARRQSLDPRHVDVNRLLVEIDELLRHSLGEDIDIHLVRGAGVWKALVDPTELESAVLNLAINARDAMPGGGRLTIETANVFVDAAYAAANEMDEGEYIVIAISDTGTGIAPDVLERVFDPFFTTKKGSGSGLGLSMVHGFARQTGGHVKIYSELGEGTTVRIYLPRSAAGTESSRPVHPQAPERGSEHVLVVEDDELVRSYTVSSLRSLGYTVSEAGAGAEALEGLGGAGRIPDLLLTDVVLPGRMSGKVLAAEVKAAFPSIRVLFMSGYTENAIVHHGRLDPGVSLLGKPFRLVDLSRKVREVLDAA